MTNQSGLAASLAGLQRFLFREVQHRCRALAALNMLPTLFGEDAAGVFQQRYHGSLTVVLVAVNHELAIKSHQQ